MLRNIFNPGNYPKNIDLILLILRVMVGFFMLTHGMGKFSKLFGSDPIKFADPIGLGMTASLALVVFSEVMCSIFLILGLATRFSAIPLIFTMFVAAFIAHANDGFGKQELPLMYAAIYLVLAITGSGIYALDQLIYKNLTSK